ncbi:MAG: DUF6687 family protein [Planctomycetota bacterium]
MRFSCGVRGGPESPLPRLRLGFAGSAGPPGPCLSVDGMAESGPNLSHWPGNRTPRQWRADLSTSIALNFVRAPVAEQEAFLGDVEWVVNDHYDTDGFGSLLAILRPDIAFAREERLVAAAGVGDFGVWQTWRAFAIDRIVKHIARSDSPVAGAFRTAKDEDQLSQQRYEWLLDHAESVLDHPGSYRALYEEEMNDVAGQIENGLRGSVSVRHQREIGCAVLASDGPLHRLALNTLAGSYRVLHIQQASGGGPYVRFHDRTESWFDLVTIQTHARRDLRELARRLAELEPERNGASWQADPPTVPIPELYFGIPSEQEYGEITRELRPSSLTADRIAEVICTFLAEPAEAN